MKWIPSISLLRLLAMLMIINCHFWEMVGTEGRGQISVSAGGALMSTLFGNYCSSGVQIFFMISGYLYGCRPCKDLFYKGRYNFIIKNIKKILLDYYVYVLLFTIPIYLYLDTSKISVHILLGFFSCSTFMYGQHHFWFLPYIILCYALTPILSDLKTWLLGRNYIIVYTILSMLGIWILLRCFCKYFVGEWILCYVIGYFLPNILESSVSKRWWKQILLVLCTFTVAWNGGYIFVHYFSHDVAIWDKLIIYNFGKVMISFSVIYVAINLLKSWHPRKCYILRFSDKYSYDIFICHMIFVKGILCLVFFTSSLFFNLFLVICISCLFGMMLNSIVKITDKYLSKCNEVM